MLGFEREVVASLLTVTEPGVRSRVEAWVEGSLRTMPEVLRLGVAVQSVAFGLAFGVFGIRGDRAVALLERSPLMPMRQYVRLLRSLVLFGEQELQPVVPARPVAPPA
jgi:hypothetical protein